MDKSAAVANDEGAVSAPAANGSVPRQRVYFKLALSALLILALIYIGRQYFGELQRLRDADPVAVVLLVGVFLLRRYLANEIMVQALRELGHHIGRGELWMLSFWRTYTNLVIPRSGVGVASVYLKAKHNVRFADYASLLLPVMVVQLVGIGFLGLGVQLFFAASHETAPMFIFIFAVVLVLGLLGSFMRFPVPNSWEGKFSHFARRLNDSWKKQGARSSLFWRVFGLQVLVALVGAAELYLAFLAIGVRPNMAGMLGASLLADLMPFISFTPNALGFREAAIVYSTQLTGVDRSVSLAAAILDRIIVTVVVIVIAQIGLWRTIRPGLKGSLGVAARDD